MFILERMRTVRWLILIAAVFFIAWRIDIAANQYHMWLDAKNDPSAQELYELNIWVECGVAVISGVVCGLFFYIVKRRPGRV